MREVIQIKGYMPIEKGTMLKVFVPKDISYIFEEKAANQGEIRIDDGRHISAEQRRKAFATIGDIAAYTGDVPMSVEYDMKWQHMSRTGCEYFSLSDCSMDTAREFINTLMEFCLEWDIPLSEEGYKRTDDIGKYLYYCLKTRHCAVCGKSKSEIHHWDRIGMGFNRNKVDDSNHRKICLCREHHTIAHARGNDTFEQMYHVYGIKYVD